MLDLAQHRCSAAAKNQVGVSVSEHVCEAESAERPEKNHLLVFLFTQMS